MSSRTLAVIASGLVVLAGAVVVLVLLASGDSGSGAAGEAGSSGAVPTQVPPAGGTQLPDQLTACLQEQGADLPSGPPGAGQAPSPDQIQALQACAQYLPQGLGVPGQTPFPGG